MLTDQQNRLELESKVLAAALKQSVERGDRESAVFAHKALFQLIKNRLRPDVLTKSELKGRSLNEKERLATISSPNHSIGGSAHLQVTDAVAPNVYDLLGLPHTSSVGDIHKSFLKRARKVLVSGARTDGTYPRKTLEALRILWIAHDTLTDDAIRADYDGNVLGLVSVAKPSCQPAKMPTKPTGDHDTNSMKIGQLLKLAGIIDQTELDIACDMHMAMREIPFGRFLIKQDFIDEEQLEAILMSQRFLRLGFITVPQFQHAMDLFKRSDKGLIEIVLEQGYINEEHLEKVNEDMKAELKRESSGIEAHLNNAGVDASREGEIP